MFSQPPHSPQQNPSKEKVAHSSLLVKFKALLTNFSIRRKLSLGYSMALGIAILGTTTGVFFSNIEQNHAIYLQEHTQEEMRLLSEIQTQVLQIRTHQQQLIPLLKSPSKFQEEYDHILKHSKILRQSWQDLKDFTKEHQESTTHHRIEDRDFHDETLPNFVDQHRAIPTQYLTALETQIEAIDPNTLNSPEEINDQQEKLLEFTNSDIALQFDSISDNLTNLVQVSYQKNQQAKNFVDHANFLRINTIIVSMSISVIIAILLVIYTSRTLTRPLLETTAVAKRVTEESNFKLQATVQTHDEVGSLTESLNQLIQRVDQLLQEQKEATEKQLIQNEKMSSLGRMLAGVAHEINNPVNFIYGNIVHTETQVKDLFDLIQTYEEVMTEPSPIVEEKKEDIELDFLEEDLPKILQSIKTGAERTRQIVLSLRNFSRLDEENTHPVDLHECLESTLLILHNRIKRDVTVIKNYGNIPNIDGYMGSLHQVFMNILNNALDALDEKNQGNKQIIISTQRLETDQVKIILEDNGCGMSPTVQKQIFQNFFTTKPLGIGTGLGLAISQQIIEEKHRGKIECESEPGQGTKFIITLATQLPDSIESNSSVPAHSSIT